MAQIVIVRKGRKFVGVYVNRGNACVECGLSERVQKSSGCTSASVRGFSDGSIRELLTNDLRSFSSIRELRAHYEGAEFERFAQAIDVDAFD